MKWIANWITMICAAFAVLFAGADTASAQRMTNYPYCAVYDFRTVSCAFNTWEQCRATVSGRGGWCEHNWAYRPPAKTKTKRRKG